MLHCDSPPGRGSRFHFVYGDKLQKLIRHLNAEYQDRGIQLTTLGACGDVNRNTMCSPIDDLDPELPLDSRRRPMPLRKSWRHAVCLITRSF